MTLKTRFSVPVWISWDTWRDHMKQKVCSVDIHVRLQSPGLNEPFLLSRALKGSLTGVDYVWCLKWWSWLKPFSQTEHLNSLSHLWTFMWCFKELDWVKPFLLTEHLKGVFLVWPFMWVFKFQEREKPFLQTEHSAHSEHSEHSEHS